MLLHYDSARPGVRFRFPGRRLLNHPANHFAGTVTSGGNSTIRNMMTNSAIMNGMTPRVTSDRKSVV